MELKEFIKESLSQIIDAVKETQEKYKDTNVVICPDNIQEVKSGLYISSENAQRNESISKIKFSIPIVLPTTNAQEYFEKHYRK